MTVCGIPLPEGLEDGSRLPSRSSRRPRRPTLGDHDENISYDAVVATVGAERADELRRLTLEVYARAEGIARERGIILADTKFEFGSRGDGTTVLGDEVLTPDSSRFWPAAEWQPGRAQPSYDKQIVRNWALSPESGWDRASGEAPAAAAGRGGRAHPRALRRGLRAAHRHDVLMPRRSVARWRSRAPRGGLRLPRRPAQPAGVAVLPRRVDGRRRRAAASGRPGSTRPSPGSSRGCATTELERPARWSETGTWRFVRADLTLDFADAPGGCTVGYRFRIHALGPSASAASVLSARAVGADLRRAARILASAAASDSSVG